MFLSQFIRCKIFSTRKTGREAVLVTGVDRMVLLRKDADFGHQCGRIGHIKAVCRSSSRGQRAPSQNAFSQNIQERREEIGGSCRGEGIREEIGGS